jgi:hypothetical protein
MSKKYAIISPIIGMLFATSAFASCYNLQANDDQHAPSTVILDKVCLIPNGAVSLYSENRLVTSFDVQATDNPSVYRCHPGLTDTHCGYTAETVTYFGGDDSTGSIDAEVEVHPDPADGTGSCQTVRYQNYAYCFFDK